MTPYHFSVTSSKRTSAMVPNMELPNSNECTTKSKRCCRKLANPSMVVTKSFWKDGTRMTITAIVCQILSGLRSKLFSMMNLHWKTTHILQQQKERTRNEKNRVLSLNKTNVLILLKQNENQKDCMMNM